ncbi:MAG: phosphoribosylformylglycinamidine synthase subunit PurS [Chloroflexota bacterium]|jgi:phosphoribosylformylglycinamidine synthase|nr:phosphoribosylformylglycinamidine synthase subunit PurS [Chloroflexota bacterium]
MSSAYRFSVSIMPRDGILDPAGRAVEAALPELHADNVHAVRVGRRVELTVESDSAAGARATVDSLAADFLANPLIESWAIEEMAG